MCSTPPAIAVSVAPSATDPAAVVTAVIAPAHIRSMAYPGTDFGSPASTRYHDVHPVGQPELRKTFKSFTEMQMWFNDHDSNAKNKVR